MERIIDFGHAPIFPEADVFPCIVVLRKRGEEEAAPPAGETEVCLFPREELGRAQIGGYIDANSYPVPMARFGVQPWSLEPGEVDELMAKIRAAGVPLREFTGAKFYRGLLTGLNEAFLIDTSTQAQLIREDPTAAEIIRPYLRGQDVKRWAPDWQDLWIILLKASSDPPWPWSSAEANAEAVFAQTYPSLHRHLKPLEDKLRKRQDKGQHWWELRACAYYSAYEGPTITYQEIQFHSAYGYDDRGLFTNNKAFIIPQADPYLLAVLNSPLMWWHNWRYLPHLKDEALSPVGALMENLPIAAPTDDARAEAEVAVGRLIALTQERRRGQRELLDWLRVEFGVETPGQKLEAFAALDGDAFADEVRRRRPRSAARLTPAALRDLRETHAASAAPIRALDAEALGLERRLSALVNAAWPHSGGRETAVAHSSATDAGGSGAWAVSNAGTVVIEGRRGYHARHRAGAPLDDRGRIAVGALAGGWHASG
ncbi:MAG: TaqI-like C-terminal specificity domain-containing protein [Thermomicrobiales bacterium]